jgi:hypothetical protein
MQPAGPAERVEWCNDIWHGNGNMVTTKEMVRPQKALSVRQPWAWAIAAGYKPVENRTWKVDYQGWIAIHAAISRVGFDDADIWLQELHPDIEKRLNDDQIAGDDDLLAIDNQLYWFGAIIGVAELAAVVPYDGTLPQIKALNRQAEALGCRSVVPAHRWAEGPYCWLLRNAIQFAEVIPCKGQTSLWTLPEELADRVAQAVRRPLPAGKLPRCPKGAFRGRLLPDAVSKTD